MSTLIDTNIVFDILNEDSTFAEWSARALAEAKMQGAVVINAVVYAELSTRFDSVEQLEDALQTFGIILEDIPRLALFLAAKAFLSYRKSGGIRTGVLPDFFIGAHAQVAGHTLLTRDLGRYGTYFPDVALITR